ncbi:hypothetical protein ACEQPO_03635 [Bacillus sp. SL00103]
MYQNGKFANLKIKYTRFLQRILPGFVHLYAGEEAVAVGVCAHLNEQDKYQYTSTTVIVSRRAVI